jgi:3-oxoacyl-[acyl-carrier protein] reductase
MRALLASRVKREGISTMPKEFHDKVVIVTGGSRGIGRAIATAFAREGARCVLASSSASNLAEAAKTVARAGAEPMTVAADLRTLAGCEQVFAQVSEQLKRCDVLVNCAGATRAGDFLKIPDEAWLDGFALKFFGAVRLSRMFWPLLTAAHGHLLNIIGGAARTVESEFLVGGSVNAALSNFTKGLSRRGMREGVNVNAIHPGATATERTETLLRQRAEASGRSVEELRAEAIAKSGVRRMAEPEDIAELALFLCSERARHIQGTATAVDGGATPGLY